MGFKNILVALDGSECSLLACRLAAQLSHAIPGEEVLRLLHCTSPIPNLIGGDQRRQLIKENEEGAEEVFAKAKEIFKSTGNPCETYIKEGDAAEVIVKTARELGCDLIIMGSRGHGKVQSILLGSVSSKVMQHADIPVLLATHKK